MKTFSSYRGGGGHGDEIMFSGLKDPDAPWYGYNTPDRVVFNPEFRAPRGKVEVNDPGLNSAGVGYVLVEPHVKRGFSADNKDWGWQRWQELANRSPFKLMQCAPIHTHFLDGVRRFRTHTFQEAVDVLSGCLGIVTTDGGLHHAAGALHQPAVVIWGCYSDPKILGYDDHENLYVPDPEGLGQRRSHPACRRAMESITVDMVLEAMGRAFEIH